MLSKEEKKKLQDFYRGKDLYDPAKDPEQEPADFSQEMNQGGECGYASGGEVEDPFSVSNSMSTATAQGGQPSYIPSPYLADEDIKPDFNQFANNEEIYKALTKPKATAQMSEMKDATASKVSPKAEVKDNILQGLTDYFAGLKPSGRFSPEGQKNESNDIVNRNRLVGMTAAPVATFADALMQGVARAGNPGFAKAINDQGQQRLTNQQALNANLAGQERENAGQDLAISEKNPLSLLNKAELKAFGPTLKSLGIPDESLKYMTSETARALLGGMITLKDAEARLAEMKAAMQERNLLNAVKVGEPTILEKLVGSDNVSTKEMAQKEFLKRSGVEPAQVPAAGGVKPKLAVNKKTGATIVSIDGGKTWRPVK